MTDRLTELLTDEPEQEAGDVSRMIQQHRNNLRRAVRPEVEALRARAEKVCDRFNQLLEGMAAADSAVSLRTGIDLEHMTAAVAALRATLEGEATG